MKALPDRISSKIWFIVAVFGLSLAGVIIHSFLVKGEVQSKLDQFSKDSTIANTEGRIVVARIDAQLKAYQDAVVSGEPELIGEAQTASEDAVRSLNRLKSLVSDGLTQRISRFITELEDFTKNASRVYPQLMSDDEIDDSVYEKSAELAQQKTDIRVSAIEITTAISDELAQAMTDLVDELGSKKIVDLLLGIVIIAAIIVMVTFIIRLSITHPFADFIQKVRILSEGDLTIRFSSQKKDELSELGKYLNHYVEGLMASLSQISKDSELLRQLADETQLSAEDIRRNSDEINIQAHSVSAAGDELSQEIATISQDADEMTSSTVSVAGAIEEMSAAIGEVAIQCSRQAQIVEEANEKASGASTLMHELGHAANEIQKIVELINAIAAQTNLLALNATIEAASAGEAGKGFAVVANEVKELAKQSSDSSDRIRAQIQNITTKTQASLKAVDEITEIMAQVSEYANTIATSVEEQSSTNQEISSTMHTVTELTEEVSKTVKTSSDSAATVATSIRGVNDGIGKFKDLADSTLDRSNSLTELSVELLHSIDQFKIK
jgi:methyl-accepting chemotaxis protein